MKSNSLPVWCLAAALPFAAIAPPVALAQDDNNTAALLDGAQRGLEKVRKEMKSQTDGRKQLKEIQQQRKAVADQQAQLAKTVEALQKMQAESATKIQALSVQVDRLEALARQYQGQSEAPKKTPPAAVLPPPAQSTPGATPAAEPHSGATPAS